MLKKVFEFIVKDQIQPYLTSKFGNPTVDLIVWGNISQAVEPNSTVNNVMVMSLVNIEEDRISRPQGNVHKQNHAYTYINPPVFLNLYVLFASHFDQDKYDEALKMVSGVIQFFQYKNVFNPANSPTLPHDVEELIFDLKTLSMQDLNNLWGVLGSRYMPSVLYKVRLVKIGDEFSQGEAPLIQEIKVNDETMLTV